MPPVDAMVPRREEAREYRRREVRRVKNAFQSNTPSEADVEGDELGAVEEGGVVVVEALRTRQREGVKKDEGVVVVGGFAASAESFERGISRGLIDGAIAADDKLRLLVVLEGVKNGRA